MGENNQLKYQFNKMKVEMSGDFIEPWSEIATRKLDVRSYAGPKDYRKALMEKSLESSRNHKEE